MRTYLVVANQTLASDELLGHVREAMGGGPTRFHLVVPATPPREHLTWTEGSGHAIAERQLDRALTALAAEGATVTGEVGDPNPSLAVDDAVLALRHDGVEVDEIVVSTLPEGSSRWLKKGLPDRIRKRHEVPVTHVVGRLGPG
jgi:hypothetical protein